MGTRNDILMPKLGLTMTEGMIADWNVKPGDRIRAGELMFIVETEKVATEIPAPSDGEMLEIIVQQGETVPVGAVIARWTGSGQSAGDQAAPTPTDTSDRTDETRHVNTVDAVQPVQHGRIVATPLARRLAKEHALTLSDIVGSGPRGRIKAQDIRDAIAGGQKPRQPSAERPAMSPGLSAAPFAAASAAQPMTTSHLVSAMAKRMVQAKQDVPHFYLSTEAEVSALLDLREKLNAQPGYAKLTVNHFLVAALARAMEDCPFQNRIWLNDQIHQFDGIDVGVAVSTERGLLAPVLHGLQGISLESIALRANELVNRVRSGQARREDMSGGAITLSNAGMFNVTYMTPIINPPQSAILGVGSVRSVFRPNASGQPVVRQEMGLVLACDHRLHDGSSGLKFLNKVVEYLQNPVWLLRSA